MQPVAPWRNRSRKSTPGKPPTSMRSRPCVTRQGRARQRGRGAEAARSATMTRNSNTTTSATGAANAKYEAYSAQQFSSAAQSAAHDAVSAAQATQAAQGAASASANPVGAAAEAREAANAARDASAVFGRGHRARRPLGSHRPGHGGPGSNACPATDAGPACHLERVIADVLTSRVRSSGRKSWRASRLSP